MNKFSTNQLHYQLVGDLRWTSAAQPHKPVITFLHGFLGNHRDWQSIVSRLLEDFSSDFCCVLIDLPGHGASLLSSDALYSMEATAQLVVEVLATNQIRTSYLYGYSMGGRLALYLALHYPDLFSKVMIESASPGLASVAERTLRQQRDNLLADQLEQNFAEFLDNWYKQSLFASLRQHPDFEALQQRRLHQHPFYLAKSLRYMGLGQQPNLWPQLSQAIVPIRLLVGEQDDKFIDIATQAVGLCPTASLRIVENTGHNIHFENPISILREIAGFYSES
jgi:2-succinyl-6-hydroxy-2,4-cyclohexadiene-1-carboxylate synthase